MVEDMHLDDAADTLILHELGLRHGAARVDLAVVNGRIHGYEIKSDSDTLERLPAQIEQYSAVLDRATLVVGEKHAAKARALLPEWWGVEVAALADDGTVSIRVERPGADNGMIDPVALAELLWRPEAAEILRQRGASQALLRKPRAALYAHLAETVPLDELRAIVRQTLKARAIWRGQRPPS
jgi:hypothetical protein